MEEEKKEVSPEEESEFDNLADFEDLDNIDMSGAFEDMGDLADIPDLTDIDVADEENAAEPSEDDTLDESPVQEQNLNTDFVPENDSSATSEDISVPDDSDSADDKDEELNSMLNGILDDLDMNGFAPSEDDGKEEELPLDSDDAVDTIGLDDLKGLDDLPEDAVDEPKQKKTVEVGKKPGLLKRLFGNVVTDEIAEQERKAFETEKEAEATAAEEAKKAAEEAKQKKAEKKEDKAKKKAEKAEAKAKKKAEKAEAKAKKKEEEEEAAALEVTGKLNKVGVSIIVVFSIAFLVVEIVGTNKFGYHSAVNNAKSYFKYGKYTSAYQEILGTDIKKKDKETYDKIMTVMKVQASLDAYDRYEHIKYYPEALNALLQGLERYDSNIKMGKKLEVSADMNSLRKEILSKLQSEFGLSEDEAYDILSLKGNAYSDKVVDIGIKKK